MKREKSKWNPLMGDLPALDMAECESEGMRASYPHDELGAKRAGFPNKFLNKSRFANTLGENKKTHPRVIRRMIRLCDVLYDVSYNNTAYYTYCTSLHPTRPSFRGGDSPARAQRARR